MKPWTVVVERPPEDTVQLSRINLVVRKPDQDLKALLAAYPAKHYLVVGSRETVASAGVPVDVAVLEGARLEDLRGFPAEVVVGSVREEDPLPLDRLLKWMDARASRLTAGEVGELAVEAQRQMAPASVRTAFDGQRLEQALASLEHLSETVIAEQVPRALVYTLMMESPSAVPSDSRSQDFDQRDLRRFVASLAEDPRVTSEPVREAARAALASYDAAVLDHHLSPHHERVLGSHGATVLLPWRRDERAGDSALSGLVDYALDAPPVTTVPDGGALAPAKALLRGYKKYVSPYLESGCPQTPSCSQYAREAIEHHGLLQGVKLGAMRFISCTGDLPEAHDPVPGCDHEHEAPPKVLLSPPPPDDKGPARTMLDGALIGAAQVAGAVAGGLAGGLAVLPVGLYLGAAAGIRAGAGTLEGWFTGLTSKYRPASVRALADMLTPAARTGQVVRQAVLDLTGSSVLASVAGVGAGAVAGAVVGGIGGAVVGGRWGGLFGGLGLAGVTKEALGELPPQPATEAILRADYS